MISTFRQRLLRQLLLFAAIPAVVLVAAGYYLLTESRGLTEYSQPTAPAVSQYYESFLAGRINQSLSEYQKRKSLDAVDLDFLLRQRGDSLSLLVSHPQLTVTAMRRIAEVSSNRPEGFVEHDGSIFQYARLANNRETLVGGYIHSAQLGALIDSAQQISATTTASRRLEQRYILFLAVILVTLLIIIVAAAYWMSHRLSRRLARPLAELSTAAERIAAGDFRQQVEPAGDDEIRSLIESFNTMARRLDETTQRLTQTERVAAWRSVARRFAHELRNPLQPLLVSLYRIEQKLMNTDVYDEVYDQLSATADEVKHLKSLAERFSKLAKLPAPKLQNVDLADLSESVMQLYEDEHSDRRFALLAPPEPVIAHVDPEYVREALHNILKNAIDATQPGGRIEVQVKSVPDGVELSVRDDGEGISIQNMAHVRLPYFTTKEKGTGLGLAIVERSVGELRGQLRLSSVEGHGTLVTMIFPPAKETEAHD